MPIARILPVVALTLLTAPAFGADANGYTAQYECRAGGPRCDLDVVTLAKQTCNQTITTADSASTISQKINGGDRFICIEPGDYTSRGTITITTSGAAGAYKVLRYSRQSDSDDEPWNQGNNQAKISRLRFDGGRYWLIHRLTIDPNYAVGSFAVELPIGSDNNIISRSLLQRGEKQVWVNGANGTVIQNSVLRDSVRQVNIDSDGVGMGNNPSHTWIVNNEIYKIHSHGIYTDPYSIAADTVVENNDIYVDSSQWTDCQGNYTPNNPDSPCSDAESMVGLKSGGTAALPIRVIHNRMWGLRYTDTNVCCIAGSNGQLFSISEENGSAATYVLALNNILSDGQEGFQSPREGTRNNSLVGNLIYRIKEYRAGISSSAFSSLGHFDNNEIYFNTVVASTGSKMGWANIGSGNSGLDVRCNAVISSAARSGDTPDSGTTVDWNAFYDTAKFTANGGDNNVTMAVTTRVSSTAYPQGTILRTFSIENCLVSSDTACFLYMVTAAGTSASSTVNVNYCNTLGCATQDGTMTVQAIRGPYTYKRKLKTSLAGGETAIVPYAMAHSSAPESRKCDPNVGTKTGVGINDDLP
jgi:hypothetical protein